MDVIIQRILQEEAGILRDRPKHFAGGRPLNLHVMNSHLGPYKIPEVVGYDRFAAFVTDPDELDKCLSILSDVRLVKIRGGWRDKIMESGVKRGSCLSQILGDVEIPPLEHACTSFACHKRAGKLSPNATAAAAVTGNGPSSVTCPSTNPTTRLFFACHHKTGTILLEHVLEVLHNSSAVGLPAKNTHGGKVRSEEIVAKDGGIRWINGEGGVKDMNGHAYLYQDKKWQARHAPTPCENTTLPRSCGVQAELWWHWNAGWVDDSEDALYDEPTEEETSLFARCDTQYRVVHLQRDPVEMVLSHIRYIHEDMEPRWMKKPVDLLEPRDRRRELDPANTDARPFWDVVEEASLDEKVALVANVTMPSIISMVRASILAEKDPEHQMNVRLEDSEKHFNTTWRRVVRFVNTAGAGEENNADEDTWLGLLSKVDEKSANYAFDFSHQTFDEKDPETEKKLCQSVLRQFPQLLTMEARLGYPPHKCTK